MNDALSELVGSSMIKRAEAPGGRRQGGANTYYRGARRRLPAAHRELSKLLECVDPTV